MTETEYIERFEHVVDLLRTTGNFTAVLVIGSVYEITSSTETFLDVDDYVSLLGGSVFARVTLIVSDFVFRVETFGNDVTAGGVWKSLAPYSDYGTRKTINAKMLQRNGGEFAYQKYPLIALRLPVPVQVVGGLCTFRANILIATFTRKQHTPQQRLEETFKPILYPLTSLFFQMLRKSGDFAGFAPDYERIDRMFYGTESGEEFNIANVFEDPLDAIELRNLELNYFVDHCI